VSPEHASQLRASDLLREALSTIQGRPGRSAALAGTVAVAVALVVANLGLAQTASSQVSDRFDARRNREVTVTVPATIGTDSVASAHLAGDAERRVKDLAGVDDAGVLATHDERSVQAIATSPTEALPLAGVSPGLLTTAGAKIEWAPGQAHRLGARQLVVGAVPAEQLELAAPASNPSIVVDGIPFAVVGVIRRVARAPQLLASVVMSERDASMFGRPSGLQVLIQTAPGAAPQVARQAPIALDPVDPSRFEIRAPVDPSSLREEIQSDIATTLLALTLVAALASMIGVANAMMVSVIERIGELGLRRAIGARPIHILSQTTAEALLLGVAGGAGGFLIGTTGVLAVTVAQQWQPVLDVRLVPVALAGGALVGVLGGLAAAIRASRIQPSDALRR
jgi:macrolide transport system ATP-binding/permease protein